MKDKAIILATFIFLITAVSSKSFAQESVVWANWSSTSSGDFADSSITVSATQTAAGVILTNPDSGTQSSFTTWAGVDIYPNASSTIENIPVQNSRGFRIELAGLNTFTLSEPVDDFYVVFTSLGAPNNTQEFEILDENDNELSMTIVGTSVDGTRACSFPAQQPQISENAQGVISGTVIEGNEANCAVKVSFQGGTVFKVNVLNDESFSVMNIAIPAGSGSGGPGAGSPATQVPTLSDWALIILCVMAGLIGIRRRQTL